MRISYLLVALVLYFFCACKSNSSTFQKTEQSIEEQLDEKNKTVLPLLQRISKIPGVVDIAGEPIFQRVLNDRSRSLSEKRPLYVVNGYPLGTSFPQLLDTVTPNDVKEINTYFGADAARYGPRGAYGVIEIITY